MKIKPGIQLRLSLLGVLPAGLIGLALAAYFIQARVVDLDRNLGIRGDLIIRALAAASVSAMASGDQSVLQHLAATALLEEDVVEVDIFDQHGNTLVSQKNQVKDDKGQIEAEYPLTQTIPVFSRPLSTGETALAGDDRVGTVRLVLSRISTIRRQHDTVVFSLIALLGGLMVSALLARRMAAKISEPVMALTLAVHELSQGHMDARAESAAEAELAYLQAGFNAMAAELKKNRESLEQQVDHATGRLQDALDALEKRNRELESARWLAEAQTELKSQFLAQMSHEIRTPMNGIIGFAELLAKTPLAHAQAEKLGLITRSAKNLLHIINDILDLSKLEAGKISLEPHSFLLRPCLEDIISLLSVRPTRPNIVLWIAPNVPAVIEGDPVRLQQVIANLLGNALKFTRRGRIIIRVRILTKQGQERLWFSVSDSGGGISPQDMAKLFSPFLQLGEFSLTAEKGAGLGLSISKNIVESMGGKIRLASRVGRGTSLWFDLPLVRGEAQQEPALVFSGTVALVEADRLFRMAVSEQLRSLGATAEAFADVDEFIEHYEKADCPQALIYGFWPKREKLDANLPRWLEWCENRQIKPILLFPCGERRLVSFYRKRGASCLFHPLRSEALLQGIETLATPDAPGSQAAPATMPTVADCRGFRLLVADDNDINRLLLRTQLQGFEADIVEACNGREALEQLRHQRFDLVFLDLQMPFMDGPQVLRELRGNLGFNRHAPVIAITAFAAPGHKESILQEGFTDCLIKPILEEQLVRLIDAWLEGEGDRIENDIEPLDTAETYVDAMVERTGGKRHLADLIARKLFVELPGTMHLAELAISGHDDQTTRDAIHKINGSAAFCGLDAIRDAAANLEFALGQGKSWETVDKLSQDLAKEISHFVSLESSILNLLAETSTTSYPLQMP